MRAEPDADALGRAAALLGDLAARDAPLGQRTTYRVGGPAALYVEARREADLDRVAEAVGRSGVPVLLLGKGSNLLVADRGFRGLALALGGSLAEVAVEEGAVVAGGGAALPVLARKAAAAGARGLEWMVGIPGTVGGAVAMNAGGHGSDVAHCLLDADVCSLARGVRRRLAACDLDFAYRHSAIGPTDVVVSASFATTPGEASEALAAIEEIVAWRRAHQPGGRNAGSLFTNPPGDSAGRLIEAAGLKGRRIGSAEVSSKHANFIQVDLGGSAEDVVALMALVRSEVARAFGVELAAEVRLVGFDGVPW